MSAQADTNAQGPQAGEVSRVRLLFAEPARVWQVLGIPILVAIALATLWVWMSGVELTTREATRINSASLQLRAREHVQLSIAAAFFVVLVAVPLGIMLTRPWARRVTPLMLAIANAGQAIPSIGLLTLLAIWIGLGPRVAVMGIVAYCILPVLRNTMVGLTQVDPAVIESGRGMGMTKRAVLWKIGLPLAVPVVLAGVRTALILAVGTMALAVFINAGGLGVIINSGIVGFSNPVLVTGAVMTAAVALMIDWAAGIAEILLRPKGL